MVLKALFGKKADQQRSGASHVPGLNELGSAESNATASGAVTMASGLAGTQPDSAVSAAAGQGEPTPAEHLEKAMIANARGDNNETRKAVYQELLFSDLLLALSDPAPAEGETPQPAQDAKDPNNLSIAILSNSSGIQFASCFTSAAAARRWRAEGGQYVSIRGQDIFKLLEPSPCEVIVINPGSAPFIVLPKVEYKQLALGIVPQGVPSPVQVAAPQGEEPGKEQENPSDQMQVAFPPDVFNAEQKAHALKVLQEDKNVEAAALGAILPAGADDNAWVRTLFLRVTGIEETAEAMQSFSGAVRDAIASEEALFKDVGFEVGVMPDPNFWVAMHQNNIVLLDRNPPAMPPPETKEGVVDASLENKA